MSLAQTLTIWSSSTGTSARSNVSLSNSNYMKSLHRGFNEKHAQNIDIATKKRAQSNKSMCWQCCTTERTTTCGSRIPCREEKNDTYWLTQLWNNSEWFHTNSWCCGQTVTGETRIQKWQRTMKVVNWIHHMTKETKSQEKVNDNHNATSSGGNCDVTAFLRPK